MSLVVTAERNIAEASLVRTAPDSHNLGLERVAQKLARGLGEFLSGLMAAPATVLPNALSTEDVSDAKDLVVRQVRLAPHDGAVVVAMERPALMRLVDFYYGGEGAEVGQRDRLSPAEVRFFSRMASGLGELLRTAVSATSAELEEDGGDESGTAAIQSFTVALAEGPSFEIECRYPPALVEAVSGTHSSSGPGGEAISDHNWQARLMDCALNVTFPVRAVFAEPELPLARLMRLRPGDIIPVCLPAQIELTVAGLRIARGSAGESSGRAAICIEHL